MKLDELCQYGGNGYLKWLILTEQVKLTAKMMDHLNHEGAATTKQVVEKLVAESEGKVVTSARIAEGLGDEDKRHHARQGPWLAPGRDGS